MGGALLFAIATAAAIAWGGFSAAALGLDSLPRVALAAYVLAWAGLVASAAALSILGVLNRLALTVTLTVLGLLGVALWLARGRPRVPAFRTAAREALADPVVLGLTLAIVPALLYLTALAFGTTPNDWDGLTYHETRALLWDQQHGVGYVPEGNEPRLNGNPPVAEIGLYLAMALPRSERLAALPQYAALWACALAVGLLARRLRATRAGASYAALVFLSLPVVLLHGAGIQNDLVAASFLLAAILFLPGSGRAEPALGAAALGLALSTKFTAVFALPIVVALVVAAAGRGRRRLSLAAVTAGVVLGSPWYLVNLVETGSFDGGLGEATRQTADLSPAAVLGTMRALLFDVVDVSGLWQSEIFVCVIAGTALAVTGAVVAARGVRSNGRTLLGAALLVVGTPLVLRGVEWPTRELWVRGWFKLGQERISLDYGNAWTVLSLPDTSLSWYGAVGALVVVGGGVAMIARVARRRDDSAALLCALAPLMFVMILSLAVVYDPWRGRMFVFAVGLACAAWAWTLRVRWLAVGVAVLTATTVATTLVHAYTKPAGRGIFEPPLGASIWRRDRIEALTVIRNNDGTPDILRAVERLVPTDADLAIGAPIDTFLAPLAGPRLRRTLYLVEDGYRTPSQARWLVTLAPALVIGCRDAWESAHSDAYGWRLLRRVAPETCGRAARPLGSRV